MLYENDFHKGINLCTLREKRRMQRNLIFMYLNDKIGGRIGDIRSARVIELSYAISTYRLCQITACGRSRSYEMKI